VNSDAKATGRLVGVLFALTFITGILAVVLYTDDPATASDARLGLGAVVELLLIAANLGTAIALFPLVRRRHEALALGYVAGRVVECTFIAVGLLSVLALTDARDSAVLVALKDWTFLLGPNFVVGLSNGLLLGVLLYRAGLVPRGMALVGMIGGPVLTLAAAGVMVGAFDELPKVAALPEIVWEGYLATYVAIKGFKASAGARDRAPFAGTAVAV
jgi:hypothetical protein